jgi:hypothetical protein
MPEATLKKPTDKATKPFWEVVRTSIDNHSFHCILKRSERMPTLAALAELKEKFPEVEIAIADFKKSEAVTRLQNTRQQLADTEARLANARIELSRAETRLQAAIGKDDLQEVENLRLDRDGLQLEVTDGEQLRQTLKDSLVAQYDQLEFDCLQVWKASRSTMVESLRRKRDELYAKLVALAGPLIDDLYKVQAAVVREGQALSMGDGELIQVLGHRPPREPHHGQPIVMRDGSGNRMAP